MPDNTAKLISVAQAEDTYDLLNHIAWTDVIKPRLESQTKIWSQWLVADVLGTKIPDGTTREILAGKINGVNYLTLLFEQILSKGEKALKDIQSSGVHLT